RIIQRLCEIESYKSMSMLGLFRSRELEGRMAPVERELTSCIHDMTGNGVEADETLSRLLKIAAELENMRAESSFRFGATGAYEAIVNQRIEVLREQRFNGRQTFKEFMVRRYDPAMRTVASSEKRLATLAERATRASDLLRTRVDVGRSAENQKLLESMDRRADLQLRLQRTVEGLSVVAISYYAVNLAIYLLAPLEVALGLSKTGLTAVVTPLVVLGVWWMIRSIRRSVD
ncbi:MAG: DUF3422 domain-containing protein, partial [Pseudomonadota bacterium]